MTKAPKYGVGMCSGISCGILDNKQEGGKFCGKTKNTGLSDSYVNNGKPVYYIEDNYKLIKAKCEGGGMIKPLSN